MKTTILQIGKTKQSYFIESENEYIKRLKAYTQLHVITLKEYPIQSADESMRQIARKKEAETLLNAIPPKTILIVLDERGKTLNSPEFAKYLGRIKDFEGGNVTFIIGGSFGLDESIRSRANLVLSLSKLTFTHEMVRTILLEQIYRAFTILQGKTYHY